MKIINTIIFFMLLITTSFAQKESFIDSRDGNEYETIKIGNQVWMAENLRYLPKVNNPTEGSKTEAMYYVYDYEGKNVDSAKNTENYRIYGVLYNWVAAMDGAASSNQNPSGIQGVCPEGWHLPSNSEWKELEEYLISNGYNYDGYDGYYEENGIAKSLASTTLWEVSEEEGAIGNNLSENNKSGFNSLPAGDRDHIDGNFCNLGNSSFYWSSTEDGADNAWYRDLFTHYPDLKNNASYKELGYSVRCIKDKGGIGLNDENRINPDIYIYPNPASNEVHINFANPQTTNKIRIVNLQGKTVYENQNFTGSVIDISKFPSAVYVIAVNERMFSFVKE